MCPSGYVLYTPKEGPDICLPCNAGTFIPDKYHKHKLCHDCTQIVDPDIEIMVRPCNTFEDTVIHCIDGYFRNQSSSEIARHHCKKCDTSCQFPKLPCDRFRDTVCCPGDNYDVVINKHGIPVCVRLCGRGEFYDSGTDKCQPCPENSYMDETRHTHTHCLPCLWPKSVAEVVVHPCNRTHPAVIGCKVGWYKHSFESSYTDCKHCHRCTKNKLGKIYEGRACTETTDTVCCTSKDMIVVDNECVHPPLTEVEPKERTSPSTRPTAEDSASLEVEVGGRRRPEQTGEDGNRCEENQPVSDTRTTPSSTILSFTIPIGILIFVIVLGIVYVSRHRKNNLKHEKPAHETANREAADHLYVTT